MISSCAAPKSVRCPQMVSRQFTGRRIWGRLREAPGAAAGVRQLPSGVRDTPDTEKQNNYKIHARCLNEQTEISLFVVVRLVSVTGLLFLTIQFNQPIKNGSYLVSYTRVAQWAPEQALTMAAQRQCLSELRVLAKTIHPEHDNIGEKNI